ncbi:cold shock protein [Proteobacteria bacterium CAG:495]|nr:cold shock protein [Proteobacteria bacterium CAG:495]
MVQYQKRLRLYFSRGCSKDVFVHITQLEKIGLRHLTDGQKVNFETYDDRGRIAAGNLKILD